MAVKLPWSETEVKGTVSGTFSAKSLNGCTTKLKKTFLNCEANAKVNGETKTDDEACFNAQSQCSHLDECKEADEANYVSCGYDHHGKGASKKDKKKKNAKPLAKSAALLVVISSSISMLPSKPKWSLVLSTSPALQRLSISRGRMGRCNLTSWQTEASHSQNGATGRDPWM